MVYQKRIKRKLLNLLGMGIALGEDTIQDVLDVATFVELDEKNMEKKSKFSQMAILSAGTFANVLTAIFFFIIMNLFLPFLTLKLVLIHLSLHKILYQE